VSLITDNNNTYVVILYQDRAFTWDLPAYSQPNYPARVGYAIQSNGAMMSKEYPYSYLSHWMGYFPFLRRCMQNLIIFHVCIKTFISDTCINRTSIW
jgi:hypothetical protein